MKMEPVRLKGVAESSVFVLVMWERLGIKGSILSSQNVLSPAKLGFGRIICLPIRLMSTCRCSFCFSDSGWRACAVTGPCL